jgi:hypothetical protein
MEDLNYLSYIMICEPLETVTDKRLCNRAGVAFLALKVNYFH